MNFQLNELVCEWSRLVIGRVDCKFGHLLKAFSNFFENRKVSRQFFIRFCKSNL